jgi:nicotinate phosphoribosyltransferase
MDKIYLDKLYSLKEIEELKISKDRKIFSATHQEILRGLTTDIYFIRTREILEKLNLVNTCVLMEIFTHKDGIICGVEEVKNLLKDKNVKVFSLFEGEKMSEKEVVMQIEGPYGEFGPYETVILGMLSSSSGWATRAKECKEAAGEKTVLCFGARHIHPAVAPVMERAAKIGGVDGVSCILGAKLCGIEPRGTVPHAGILIVGDTVKMAEFYDKFMPLEVPRIILIDTFKDEAEEALRVAKFLKEKLAGIRLDTPEERGGVTPDLVKEVRRRLDIEGFEYVKIFVSGGLNPQRIKILSEAGADAFGVGSYISSAPPIEMTMDIREIENRPIAKRGRTPGRTKNPRLKKLI